MPRCSGKCNGHLLVALLRLLSHPPHPSSRPMISVGSADGRWAAWRWRYFPAVLRVVVLRTRESREDSQVSVTPSRVPNTNTLAIRLDRDDPYWYQGPPYIAVEVVFDGPAGSAWYPRGKRTRNSWQGVLNRRATLSLSCDLWGKRSCDGVCARLKGGDRQSLS